tara:strand:- start:30 stop:644 length:615 start_codon:yes stop_codon:yes gene_type:complete
VASLTGWGRETWGNGAWGTNGVLEVTGVEAAGAIGSETVVIVQTIAVTGVEATGSIGNIIFQADLITGWGRSTWGSGVWGDAAVVLETGVEAASAIGSSTVVIPVSLSVTGVEAASAIGTVSVGTFVTISATGVEAASAIGTVTASGKSIFSVTGVEAVGKIGTVGKGVAFSVTGVEARGVVNTPMVWSVIDTSSGTIWTEIAA